MLSEESEVSQSTLSLKEIKQINSVVTMIVRRQQQIHHRPQSTDQSNSASICSSDESFGAD
jgi:hypothetical protein